MNTPPLTHARPRPAQGTRSTLVPGGSADPPGFPAAAGVRQIRDEAATARRWSSRSRERTCKVRFGQSRPGAAEARRRSAASGKAGRRRRPASGEESDRRNADTVQPLAKVRVRHHQVDQPAVLGTRYTRHAQRARVSGTDGALGHRLFSDLDHLDPLKQEWFSSHPERRRPHATF